MDSSPGNFRFEQQTRNRSNTRMDTVQPRARLDLGNNCPCSMCSWGFLLYIFVKPFIHLPEIERLPRWRKLSQFISAEEDKLDLDVPRYKRIGVALAHNDIDKKVLSHALPLARQHDAVMFLFHVVEGAAGVTFGPDAYDTEAREDEAYLNQVGHLWPTEGLRWKSLWALGRFQRTDSYGEKTEHRYPCYGRPRP